MDTYPAIGSAFFGRVQVLDLLSKRLQSFQQGYRQNIGIIGYSGLGKTSLLYQIRELTSKIECFPIYFQCHEQESFERFADRWMAEILMSFYQKNNETARVQFSDLLKKSKDIIPKTISHMKKIKKSILRYRYDQAFRDLLQLTSVLQEETGKKLVLLIDDFDRLSALELTDVFAMLGQEIMTQKETMYFVTSSSIQQSRAILREKMSLLFGNFEIIELHPFEFEESLGYITKVLGDFEFEDRLKRYMIRLTDGHPYYLTVLLEAMKDSLSQLKFESSEEWLLQALRHSLYEPHGILNQFFKCKLYQLDRSWSLTGDLLSAIAAGEKKTVQQMRFLHKSAKEIKKCLAKLIAEEVLQKHGSLFLVPDSLFRFWLSKVYFHKRFSYGLTEDMRADVFRQEVKKTISESETADRSELPKRIEELFKIFRNDVVELNERKLTCPHFSEVVSKPNNGRVFPVVAKNGKTRWMCQVVSKKVIEDDVNVFLQDLLKLRSPVQKRIMIGLQGIDLNAKLLAQESKIQYLDLRKFNFLLDLYDKPKLVV